MSPAFESFGTSVEQETTPLSFRDQVPLTPEENETIMQVLSAHDAVLKDVLLGSEYVNPGHVEIESGVYLLHQQLGQVASEARLFKALSTYVANYPEEKKQVYRRKLERVRKVVYEGEFQQHCLQEGHPEAAGVLEKLLRAYEELMNKYGFQDFEEALA